MDFLQQPARRKKKKVDYEAVQSPLNRIPGIETATVRDLIDIGLREVDDLRGRAPEALFDDICSLREQTPAHRLPQIRLAVYFAETDDPDPALLQPHKWENPF